ncbi:MAG: hypothetical protein V1668_02770 [Patescibacteria group bacterium]
MIDTLRKPLGALLTKKGDGGVGETKVIVFPDGGTPIKATLIGRNHEKMFLRVPGQDNIVSMLPGVPAELAR